MTGIPQGNISRIERGKIEDIHLSRFVILMRTLEVSADTLLSIPQSPWETTLQGFDVNSSQLRQISLGMSKSEVVAVLGEPVVARGSIKNRYNQIIEVWEYALALPSKDSSGQIAGKTMLTLVTIGVGAATFRPEKRTIGYIF